MTESLPPRAYKLCTVDVWDTVLRRRCHPDAVKLETGRKLLLAHAALLRPEYRDGWALLALRCGVEGELARAAAAANPLCDDEYTLRAVLEEWVARAFIEPPPQAAELVCRLEQAEFEHESQVCYVDPGIRERIAATPAEKTVFLSDFYMPATRLRELLEAKGVAGWFDGGHSSCDHRLNKRSGRLFDLAQSIYGVQPEEHLHIGDNPLSDCEVPRQRRIHALHYLPAEEQRLREQRSRMFRDRPALFEHIDRECRSKLQPAGADVAEQAYAIGVGLAPLFAGFALFLLEAAQRDRLDSLYFFTREGEFFIKLYQTLRSAYPATAAPAGVVLDVSRMATFCASLREVSTGEMMRLWNLYSVQSLHAWGQSLRLPPELVSGWCRKHGLPFDRPIRYPWLDEGVLRLFGDAQFRTTLAAVIADNCALLLEHLATRGLSDDGRTAGVVDIGWRGTIQDNLALLLPATRLNGYYLGLQTFLNAQPANCVKSAFGPDLNRGEEGARLFGKLPLLEMLCNSPAGSVTGYRRGAQGQVESLRLKDEQEDATFHDLVAHLQDGVLAGVRFWAAQLLPHAVSSSELRPYALQLWSGLIENPPPAIARAHLELRHNELFGLGSFTEKKSFRPQLFLKKLLRRVQ